MEKRIASRMSLGNWSPVRSLCLCSRFSHFRIVCERSFILVAFGGDKIWRLSSKLLPAASGSYKAAVFAIVPELVPVQLHEQPPELLLQFLRSRSVATTDPSRSSRQSRVGDLSRRSAASGFCILYRLFSSCVHHTNEVPCQVRPGSPTRAGLLPEMVWH